MTINYRDTLNLPETELSMKAGLPRKEPEIIEFWNDIDIYKKLRELHENDETTISSCYGTPKNEENMLSSN